MDADERLRQLDEDLDRSCAASGVPVEITDPVTIARLAALFRGSAATAPVSVRKANRVHNAS